MTIKSNKKHDMNRLTLSAIRQLLRYGEAAAADLSGLDHLRELDVVRLSQDGQRVVAAPGLVRILRLLGEKEAEAGIFVLYPEIEASWLTIICARFEEMGIQDDINTLFAAIDQLGTYADLAVGAWEKRSLDPTRFALLEKEILGAPANEAVSGPKLLRALSAAGNVLSSSPSKALSTLLDIDAQDPGLNWVKSRVILPPGIEPLDNVSAVLSGSIAPMQNAATDDVMTWVLACPWIFLMGQLVFMQEAWQAERISGELVLELDREQLAGFHQPDQINVVVTMPDGSEVQCGTLGALMVRALDALGIALLTANVSNAAMDAMLAPVVNALLTYHIWDFESGKPGRAPQYHIHQTFSDVCYRTLGSRLFYRKGTHVTMSLRQTCEDWAKERLARAGVQAVKSRMGAVL